MKEYSQYPMSTAGDSNLMSLMQENKEKRLYQASIDLEIQEIILDYPNPCLPVTDRGMVFVLNSYCRTSFNRAAFEWCPFLPN